MACPVLLAVATKKVNISREGNAAVRHGIPPLAAISLFLCPLAFLSLRIGSGLRSILGLGDYDVNGAPQPLKFCILGCTKLLVHVSAILQMLLAYMIFLLITMNLGAPLLTFLILSCVGVLASGIWSVVRITRQRRVEDWEAVNGCWWNKNLEMSLDMSAAVTSLLFLGLEGLALEDQTKDPIITASLGKTVIATFICCVFASAVMLVATVPPMDRQDADRRGGLVGLTVIYILWAVLAICFITVVTMILIFVLHNNIQDGFAVALVPCAVLFVVYVLCLICVGDDDDGQHQPPASLEMTKVTFTAFLAISLPSFRGGGDLSVCTRAFIVTTAMSVIFGIGWRLFSHFERKVAVWTSKVACLFTNACLAAAAIELMCMAMQALSVSGSGGYSALPATVANSTRA